MSEIPGSAPGWEWREPPDYELDPPDPKYEPIDVDSDYYFDDELYGEVDEQEWLRDMQQIAERIDGRGEIDLFKNVIVSSSEGELRFKVPPRIIETTEHGMWVLEVDGKREWFKERGDYGEIRIFADGSRAIWVPHLFAFEQNNDENMPLFPDRERLNVEISLTRLSIEGEPPYPMTVRVDTMNGEYGAREDIGLSYGTNAVYFQDFVYVDGTLVAYDVEYPEFERPSIVEYVSKLEANGEAEKAKRILSGTEELPPEFRKPEPIIQMERSELSGAPFGTLWVPVEILRQGSVYAKISFPNFQ